MKRDPLRLLVLFIAFCGIAGGILAQGTQTGTLSGTVRTSQGDPLPGVTITLTSPALQGQRTAVTAVNGDYIARGLPPGDYKATFSMPGMTAVERDLPVTLAGTTKLDVAMELSKFSESVRVTGEAISPIATTQLGANYRNEEINKLPVGRNLNNIAANTPGITGGTVVAGQADPHTPNAGQVHINGGQAFDNVFLIDGTDINDNLFGTANNLFIEDSIAEVQVLTGGIPAEYGRFGGGVINAITKSGGNLFSGTARVDFTNTDWTKKTPFEESRNLPRVDKTNKAYTATLGGPILKDGLWFYGGGRFAKLTDSVVLSESGIVVPTSDDNKRYEGKLTGNIANHTLQASYLKNDRTEETFGLGGYIDPRGKINRTLPNTRWAASHNGVWTSALFTELKYSEKKFGFRNSGGTLTDIHESPILARTGPQRVYNAPYFSSLDPEDRNNREASGSVSYFVPTAKLGSHELKAGYEWYDSNRNGGNSQSATGYVIQANFKRNADSTPAVDANGRYIPLFIPTGQTGAARIQNWIPVVGARLDIKTKSAFFMDRWALNDHFSFNLGVRYEKVTGDATGGIVTVDSTRWVPRVAAAYDVKGDSRLVIKGSYGQYSGKYNEREFGQNTNVGKPNLVLYEYKGPAGEGLDFAPGFDFANYNIISGSFPTANVFVDPKIKSPVIDEWTGSVGSAIGKFGYVQLTYVDRKYSSFYEDFIDLSTGTTTVNFLGRNFGTFDNQLYGNTDSLTRKYQALQFQGRYRITQRWSVDANYTRELKNHGNIEGEAANQPGNPSTAGDYPEIYAADRNFPYGRLAGYQRDKFRFFNTYTFALGRFGNLDFGLLYRYDSPLTFNIAAAAVPLSAEQKARTPAGYSRPPTSQTLFFGERGAGEFQRVHGVDVALNYGIPVWKTVEPWIKFEVRNLTNEQALQQFDTTVTANNSGPKDANGLATTYTTGPNFGKATASTHYQSPRTYLASAGIRF
ncbi:MAG: TonB-dependent receptor [Acidobacteria bacterium]|nr:TonB-dependent receptor [Acidobacteriota bacterium]MCA1617302.1 TonB-dependent receptor [Acidobacteriota bacterium]